MKRELALWLCLFVLVSTASAHDAFAPDWRGQERTVHAEWNSWDNVLIDPGYVIPDNGYWDIFPSPWVYFPWQESLYDYYDVWHNQFDVIRMFQPERSVNIHLPNYSGGEYKRVRLQVTYYDPFGYLAPQHIEFKPLGGSYQQASTQFVGQQDIGSNWYVLAWDFEIWPNPESEIVSFGFDNGWVYPGGTPAAITQLVIDTQCVPEPATLTLLTLGALALRRKRRT